MGDYFTAIIGIVVLSAMGLALCLFEIWLFPWALIPLAAWIIFFVYRCYAQNRERPRLGDDWHFADYYDHHSDQP